MQRSSTLFVAGLPLSLYDTEYSQQYKSAEMVPGGSSPHTRALHTNATNRSDACSVPSLTIRFHNGPKQLVAHGASQSRRGYLFMLDSSLKRLTRSHAFRVYMQNESEKRFNRVQSSRLHPRHHSRSRSIHGKAHHDSLELAWASRAPSPAVTLQWKESYPPIHPA